MNYYFNKKTIAKFYYMSLNVDFDLLDNIKIEKLNNSVEYWRYFFENQSCGLLTMMTCVAEKMITSTGRYGAVTPEEKLYFYLKMIDPDFLFLEASEVANKTEEVKELCLLNFRIHDPFIIKFEKKLYKRLQYKEELWARERIKRL